MTLDDILQYIRDHRDKARWYIIKRSLRCEYHDSGEILCPLTFVCFDSKQKYYWTYDAWKASQDLGVTNSDDVHRIVQAADGSVYPKFDDQDVLRQKLIEACGMRFEHVQV